MIILHADTNHPVLAQELEKAGHLNVEGYSLSREEIIANQHLFDGIVIRSRFRMDENFLRLLPNLRFIARVGAGLENIDVAYARKSGIALFSAPEGNRDAVGEHALGMLLSLMNKLNQADRQVREGLWYREMNRGTELTGKTVGIIGYGNMGKALARKLRGFDVEVLCHDINEGVGDENAKQVPLHALQSEAEIVSLHTPLTPASEKMVNRDFIMKFKKPFWFLNTARGKCVVTEDLVWGLSEGKILGAGLDVLEYEKTSFEALFSAETGLPEAFQQLLLMKNVILSPHVAGWTTESHEKLARVISEKIVRTFGKGTPET